MKGYLPVNKLNIDRGVPEAGVNAFIYNVDGSRSILLIFLALIIVPSSETRKSFLKLSIVISKIPYASIMLTSIRFISRASYYTLGA